MGNENNLLKEEIETYAKEKKRLVAEANGKFVLIRGKDIVGIFESQNDAIKIGVEKFGNTPFLVKRIEEIEQKQNYTSNLIQLIKCHH